MTHPSSIQAAEARVVEAAMAEYAEYVAAKKQPQPFWSAANNARWAACAALRQLRQPQDRVKEARDLMRGWLIGQEYGHKANITVDAIVHVRALLDAEIAARKVQP